VRTPFFRLGLLIGLLTLAGCAGQNKPQTQEEQIEEMRQVAAQYPETHPDLADYSKFLILSGNSQKLEYFYLKQYQRALALPNRELAAPAQLYQIFLAMTDPFNPSRSFNKARKYFSMLKTEWPTSPFTQKVRQLANDMNL
tara:strand:- start:9149 stop:9571 length:423 start_codon:yes stop_codon:yes gene_type:complete